MTNQFQRLKWVWAGLPSFTLVDLAINGERLTSVVNAWRSDLARPARLHLVGWVSHVGTLSTELSTLGSRVPPALPGVHLIDVDARGVSLTLFVGVRVSSVTQLRGHVDAVWLDQRLVTDLGAVESLLKRNRFDDDTWLAERCRSSMAASRTPLKSVIVIGGGLAGTTISRALALRGWQVSLLDADGLTEPSRHLGHHSAAITPQISTDDDQRARLSRAGLLRAAAQWQTVPASIANWCGSIQLERLEGGRVVDLQDQAQTLGFDPAWVRYVGRVEASELAGTPVNRGGLYFPMSCQVQPNELVQWLTETSGLKVSKTNVVRIEYANEQWHAYSELSNMPAASATKVILANSGGTKALLARSGLLPKGSRLQGLHALGGEISLLPAAALGGGPDLIVGGDGYVLPAVQGVCVSGATYVHAPDRVETTTAGRRRNLERASDLLGLPLLSQSQEADQLPGWAGLRAVLPGRFPAIGPMSNAPGLWVATAFASRGLTWSALAADLIVAAFEGEPIPLENDLMKEVSPN